jgi:hypothetical protein
VLPASTDKTLTDVVNHVKKNDGAKAAALRGR